MITALIVDDEPPARARLRRMLAAHPDVTVLGEEATAEAARRSVAEHEPDVVFLDISLPDREGFAVVDSAGSGPAVVFVTAHADHAVRAWDVDAVDYLLKPFHPERLATALERLRRHLGTTATGVEPVRRLPIESGGRVIFLDIAAIQTLRADRNYVRVSAGSRSYLVRSTLSAMSTRLAPAGFVRAHRSVLVNTGCVVEVETLAHGELLLRMANGEQVITGRTHTDAVRQALGL